jgi:hypothetical protein
MATPAPYWSFLQLARGNRTRATAGLRRVDRLLGAHRYRLSPPNHRATPAPPRDLSRPPSMLVSLLMTVADRQLRTAPARVNFSTSSDKPPVQPLINMTDTSAPRN